MRTIFFFCTVVLAGALLAGCSCEDSGESKKKAEVVDLSKPPPPLVAKPAPPELEVGVFPQKGAVEPRPVAMVLAEDQKFCQIVRSEWEKSGHVLCTEGALEVAQSRLRKASAYLKDTYPRHVGKPPVHLFTDAAHSEVGWRLMLKEPGFFSYAFLPGLSERALTHTTLSALHSRGARELALGIESSNRLKLLETVAARRGLQIHTLGGDAGALKSAIALMKERDARLRPPAAPVQPSPSP